MSKPIQKHLRNSVDEWIWEEGWLQNKCRFGDPKIRLWAFQRMDYCYPETATPVARTLLSDEDVFIQQAAAKHLGTRGDPDEDPALLEDPFETAPAALKGTILNALAGLGDEEAVLKHGDPLLHQDSVNINLILAFIDALTTLDTDDTRSKAMEMYRKTRTEAVFSTLTPYLIQSLEDERLEEIARITLDKLAENAMIKIRHFCRQVYEQLYLSPPDPPSSKPDGAGDPASQLIEHLSDSYDFHPPDVHDEPDVRSAIEQYLDGSFVTAIDQLGQWAKQKRSDTGESGSKRKRQVLGFLSGFASPPGELSETDVPGDPLSRIVQLGLVAWMHYDDTPHPEVALRRARESDEFPETLYRDERPFLIDEISQVASETRPDPSELLSDASSSTSEVIRAKALNILSRMQEPDALPVLVDALNHSRSRIYETAAKGLVRYGETALPALDEAIEEGTLKTGLTTAADVLRRIPTERSADLFLTHFDRFVEQSGVDPIVSFATDLAKPEMADAFRTHFEQHPLLVGEQLEIICKLFDLPFPEQKEIEEKRNERAEQNKGGPQFGSPFPGGESPPSPDIPPMPGQGPES